MTAQKDAIKDITSDNQVNNHFLYRWGPASLTFYIYFNLFLYSCITRITINNGRPHLKSPKNQNRIAALGRPAIKLLGEPATSQKYQEEWKNTFTKIHVDTSVLVLKFSREFLHKKVSKITLNQYFNGYKLLIHIPLREKALL